MRIIATTLILILVLMPITAQAVTITKIGFVDISRILTAIPALQVANQRTPVRTTAPRPNRISNESKITSKLGDLGESYYRLMLDELDRPSSQSAITADIDEVLMLIQSPPPPPVMETPVSNSGSALISADIMERIMAAVQFVGQREGFSVIVEKSNILYGHPAVNITNDVINYLRNE